MPVKIVSKIGFAAGNRSFGIDGGVDTLHMPQATLVAAHADFRNNYSDANGNVNFDTPCTVRWSEFISKIGSCGYAEGQIGLSFIHRYDTAKKCWFLSMQCCEITDTGTTDPEPSPSTGTFNIYQITQRGAIYDLNDITMPVSGLSTGTIPYGPTDAAYFANILDSSSKRLNQTVSPSGKSIYVNSIVFPWSDEIKKMHDENGLSDTLSNVYIKFASCTCDCTSMVPSRSLINFPHGIVAYMNVGGDNGFDYLNDGHYVSVFMLSASDFGTLCPPRCGFYDRPSEL